MRRLVTLSALALLAAACGPRSTTPVTPILPGDGDAHVAKPTDPVEAGRDPWAGRTDLVRTPPPAPPAPLALPPIERFTLKNGLRVFVIKDERLPTVGMQLAVVAGRADEPRARLGVAAFTAEMLLKGTRKRNALAIAKAIDFVGGSLRADATFEATMLSCRTLAKDLPTCLGLVPELLTQPAFPADEMTKVREQLLAQVRQRLDDAGQLAGIHFQNLLWGEEHVRGWVWNEATVNAITRDDLVAWHRTWFSPSNALLTVAGDVDPARLKAQLEKAFAPWKKQATPPRPTYPTPRLDRVKIRLVDKPQQTQAHIRIGHYGIQHTDPRFFDTLVWNYALGGGAFSSRLLKVVRSEAGKTYGASSTFDRNLDRGSFVATTFTRSAETVATIDLVLAELDKMQKRGPTEAEVADAISNISGAYALRFESADDLAGALLAAELHGFGEEYVANYAVRIGKVDVASARAAAAEILDAARFVIVVVGEAAAIEPQLKKKGWKYEKVHFLDPIGVPAVEAPAVDAGAEQAARKLLDEALAAKGKRITQLKSLKMKARGKLTAQGMPLDIVIERVYLAPDKMRVDLEVDVPGMGKQTIAYALDGSRGWQAAEGQVVDIPAQEAATLIEQRWHDPELILTRHLDKQTRVIPHKDDRCGGGTPCAVVQLISGDGRSTATIYLDKKTKLIRQLAYPEGGRTTIDVFSGYRTVDGVQIAHQRQSKSGNESAELTVERVELDPAVDPAIFARPAGKAAPQPSGR
jgi:zinc protease